MIDSNIVVLLIILLRLLLEVTGLIGVNVVSLFKFCKDEFSIQKICAASRFNIPTNHLTAPASPKASLTSSLPRSSHIRLYK